MNKILKIGIAVAAFFVMALLATGYLTNQAKWVGIRQTSGHNDSEGVILTDTFERVNKYPNFNFWELNYKSDEDYVYSFVVFNKRMYAATGPNGKIYSFDGDTWSESYDATDSEIYSLEVYGDNLYAGGRQGHIYVYDGTTWSLLESLGADQIWSLKTHNGKLYAGTGATGKIFAYDGSWSEANDTSETHIYSLNVFEGKLYAGSGDNGIIYSYDGNSWTTVYDSDETRIRVLDRYENKIYAGTGTNGKIYVFPSTVSAISTQQKDAVNAYSSNCNYSGTDHPLSYAFDQDISTYASLQSVGSYVNQTASNASYTTVPYNPTYCNDGIWTTGCFAYDVHTWYYFFGNFTRQAGALNGSIVEIKSSSITNYTIPEACLNQTIVQFLVSMYVTSFTYHSYVVLGACWDGSSWQQFHTDYSSYGLFDIAVFWSQPVTCNATWNYTIPNNTVSLDSSTLIKNWYAGGCNMSCWNYSAGDWQYVIRRVSNSTETSVFPPDCYSGQTDMRFKCLVVNATYSPQGIYFYGDYITYSTVTEATNWSVAYDGADEEVYSLEEYNGKLYAGTGRTGGIYIYDGVDWTASYAIKDYSPLYITSLGTYLGTLYAGTGPQGAIYAYTTEPKQEVVVKNTVSDSVPVNITESILLQVNETNIPLPVNITDYPDPLSVNISNYGFKEYTCGITNNNTNISDISFNSRLEHLIIQPNTSTVSWRFKLTDDDGIVIYDGSQTDQTGRMGLIVNVPLIGKLNTTLSNVSENVNFSIKVVYT